MTVELEILCNQLQISYETDLLKYSFIQNGIHPASYAFTKSRRVLPLMEEAGIVTVAVEDPLNLEALEELRALLQKPIKEIGTSKEALDAAIEACYHQRSDAASSLIHHLKEQSGSTELKFEGYDLLDQTADSPVVRLLNLMITEAIQQGASDIHFEPSYNGLMVRYRIDGVLQQRHEPPKELQASLISRIKVLAKLDIAEQRLPQDGRIKLYFGGREIDFRVSTIPVVDGERVVLRILDKSNIVLGLSQLGMPPALLDRFESLIHFSEGIILVTGPTGSGKTTTLYSAVSDLSSPDVNIMTIEDPVEYKLPHIAQVGVNPKIQLTFGAGLRHILRQDPDVIMIGEIRDKETAEIAIQASLTGHLVLSTLHTNDAPSAMTRLVDMGIEPYLLSSSVIGILAQRLVRTNCPHCLEKYDPTENECRQLGLTHAGPFYRGVGCPHCFGVGYKGRMAIYELLTVTPPIKEELLVSADSVRLRKAAIQEGMSTLLNAGAALVQAGRTTSSEVLRVTRGYEET
jgi:general secretion pathway protein E